HAGAALLPGLGADLARTLAPRSPAATDQVGRALAGQMARERTAQQHARVCQGVGLQGRRSDGAAGQPARADLVAGALLDRTRRVSPEIGLTLRCVWTRGDLS